MNLSMISWTKEAWDDYLYWQTQDKKMLKRINVLIKDIMRSPFDGIGKPEALRFELNGYHSRRIDNTHRLVYCVKSNVLIIVACRYHYA